jgi:hypothetical protein
VPNPFFHVTTQPVAMVGACDSLHLSGDAAQRVARQQENLSVEGR